MRRVPQNRPIPRTVEGSSRDGPGLAAWDTGPGRASDRLTRGPEIVPRTLTAFLPAFADCHYALTRILLNLQVHGDEEAETTRWLGFAGPYRSGGGDFYRGPVYSAEHPPCYILCYSGTADNLCSRTVLALDIRGWLFGADGRGLLLVASCGAGFALGTPRPWHGCGGAVAAGGGGLPVQSGRSETAGGCGSIAIADCGAGSNRQCDRHNRSCGRDIVGEPGLHAFNRVCAR